MGEDGACLFRSVGRSHHWLAMSHLCSQGLKPDNENIVFYERGGSKYLLLCIIDLFYELVTVDMCSLLSDVYPFTLKYKLCYWWNTKILLTQNTDVAFLTLTREKLNFKNSNCIDLQIPNIPK